MIPRSLKNEELKRRRKRKKHEQDEPEDPGKLYALVVSYSTETNQKARKALDDLPIYTTTFTGHDKIEEIIEEHYDFVIIDDNDRGLTTLRKVRKVNKTAAILYVAPIAFPDIAVPVVERENDARLNRMGFGIEEDIRKMYEDYVAKKKK
jgi:hypothetical protein